MDITSIRMSADSLDADVSTREGRIDALLNESLYIIRLETVGNITQQDITYLLGVGLNIPPEHVKCLLEDGFAVPAPSLDTVLKRMAHVFYVEKHTRLRFHVEHVTATEYVPPPSKGHVFLGINKHGGAHDPFNMMQSSSGLNGPQSGRLRNGSDNMHAMSLEDLLNDIGTDEGDGEDDKREPGTGRVFLNGVEMALDNLPDDMPDELKAMCRTAVENGDTLRLASSDGAPPLGTDGKPVLN